MSQKKTQKYWRKHKVSYCDKFWRKMSGDETETDATLAFNPNNRKAVFLVEKKESQVYRKGTKTFSLSVILESERHATS